MPEDIITKMRREGLLEEAAAQRVRELQRGGEPLEKAITAAGGVSEEEMLRFFSREFSVPCVDLDEFSPDRELLSRFPARLLLQHKVLPLEKRDGSVLTAVSTVFDTSGIDELRMCTEEDFQLVLAPESEIDRHIKSFLGVGADTVQSLVSEAAESGVRVLEEDRGEDVDLTEAAEDASIIKFVNQVLSEAIELRATDVHFEPFEDQLRVRYRVDGLLQEASIPAEVRSFQPAIISRLKILSHLDIAEKRLPQDGRIKLSISGREIDVRVSVIPMLHGEAVVLRLLDRSSALMGLKELGMSGRDRESFERILAMPHGIVLVTGPTGSGKTTTLYAALSRINDIQRKIITIEDPVEYQLHGINQIQVATKAGMTFARGMRSILRHDPDVILVGEIRDLETAQIAVQASLTGHLVFSTLHTNDAPGAPTRLVDMGIEPYLVASSLEAVLAQRLVRLICPDCRKTVQPTDPPALVRQMGGEAPEVLYEGAGCRQCQGTGYRGRRGIFELMNMTEGLQTMILEGASSGEVRKLALQQGMVSLREDGWRHVREGATTVEEVLRVTKDERMEVEKEESAPRGS